MKTQSKLTFQELKQVTEVLSNYRRQRGILSLPINPGASVLDIAGVKQDLTNGHPFAQRRAEQREEAANFIAWVDGAISSVPNANQARLLRLRYCDGAECEHPDQDAASALEVSRATYTRWKHAALYAVAYMLGVRS